MTPAMRQHRVLITISVMVASIMQALDATIANVALPRMQGSLSATQDQINWVLTSYIIATAIMMPLSSWLAGQFGRKRVFLLSIAVFTAASVLCGLAHTLSEMVVFRALQGVGGAALVPMSQAVLLDINPPERHGRAMSVWGMGVVLGPIIGPVIGGWLTDDYNWRWVFYINVPFGIISFLGVLVFLAESAKKRSGFDFFGFLTLSFGLGALQMMLDRGPLKDWFNATEIWIEATIAALGFYLFAVHTATARAHPFISPSLFRDRNFLTGTIFIFIVGAVLFATLALLPPLLQEHMGYPVFLTGIVTAPRGVGTLLSMLVVGRLIGRIATPYLILFGLAATAFSLWQMTGFSLLMDAGPVMWSGFIQGVGTGFVYIPLAAVAFATLDTQLRNEATSMFNLTRNIGSAIGISAVAAFLARNTQVMHSALASHLTVYGAHGAAAGADLALLNQRVTEQAAMIAYNDDFKLMMILTICAIPFVFLLHDVKRQTSPALVME
jgi:DHA2 family multidrug resistance protein